MIRAVSSFLLGVGFARASAPFVEWGVHRYLLHPKSRNIINKGTSRGHAKHHAEYSGVKYFEDENNKDAVSRFSATDVACIIGIGGVVGAAINNGYALATHVNPEDYFFTAGTMVGCAYAWGKYEFLHWLMHKVDEPRQETHLSLGDMLQPNGSDDELRFSRPVLNEMFEEIYTNAMHAVSSKGTHDTYQFSKTLEDKLDYQLHENGGHIEHPYTAHEVLVELTHRAVREEREKQSKESWLGGLWRGVKQYAANKIRNSNWFKTMDDHHVVHHFETDKNLNVAFKVADYVFGTKVDSSPETLNREKDYWMCPNPEIKEKKYANAA